MRWNGGKGENILPFILHVLFEFHAFQTGNWQTAKEMDQEEEEARRRQKYTKPMLSHSLHMVEKFLVLVIASFSSRFMIIFARMYGPFDHLGIQQIHSESALLARIHAQKYTHTQTNE